MDLRRKICTVISSIVTVGLIVILLKYSTNLMERKSSDIKFSPFFEEKENYDVLFMGTSHVLNAVFPMELWNDYGIVSYNCGGHGNALATTYWIMENTLEYTAPQLMVIDCYGLSDITKTSTSYFGYVHSTFDAFPLGTMKLKAIFDLLDDEVAEDIVSQKNSTESRTRLELLWNYSIYHTRWNELTKEDFIPTLTKEKGAESRIAIGNPVEIEKISEDDKMEGDTISVKYLEKMIEDCQRRGIDILLVYIPWRATDSYYQREANRINDIAEKYNINYINFLNKDIVDWKTDLYDEGRHLNPSGARKITDFLGHYITEHYNILDQRRNEDYSDWYFDYKEYKDFKLANLKAQESLDLYLMLLADKSYSAIIKINNTEIWNNHYYINFFENLGVEIDKITENVDILIIQEDEKKVKYLEDLHSYIDGKNASLIDSNNKEYYTRTLENDEDADIQIGVIDNETKEIVDIGIFSITSKNDIKEDYIETTRIDRE